MSSLVIEYKGYPKEDIFLLTEQRSSFPRIRGGDPELYKYFKWKRRAIRFGSNAGNTDKINILLQRNIKMYSSVLSYRIEYVSMKE